MLGEAGHAHVGAVDINVTSHVAGLRAARLARWLRRYRAAASFGSRLIGRFSSLVGRCCTARCSGTTAFPRSYHRTTTWSARKAAQSSARSHPPEARPVDLEETRGESGPRLGS